MAMNVGPGNAIRSRDPDVMIDINTTPLIDVMLVLLVMLIITLPIQLHSVNLNMPTGNPPPPPVLPKIVKIHIDEARRLYCNRQSMLPPAAPEAEPTTAAAAGVPPDVQLRTDNLAQY